MSIQRRCNRSPITVPFRSVTLVSILINDIQPCEVAKPHSYKRTLCALVNLKDARSNECTCEHTESMDYITLAHDSPSLAAFSVPTLLVSSSSVILRVSTRGRLTFTGICQSSFAPWKYVARKIDRGRTVGTFFATVLRPDTRQSN